MSKAKCIMVQGTMSGAGKSLLCAALCRIFAQDGYRVAPFKSQNMALNSFVTRDGLEMGRAQVVQAQAAGIEPDVRMNPILLKPSSDVGSQVIVNGEVRGQMSAAAYFKMKRALIPEILSAYNSLAETVDIIVIEGAGSPAEINLKADDIVNMGLARLVDAPVLLAGDIDRGGVFAQLYGTVALLEPEERARIKGLLINKFRGDVEILRPGLAMLEEKTQLPVLGVVPYLKVDIEDEDSLSTRLDACSYNKMVEKDEAVSTAWSNVETQYQRRADLIPNLVSTVKGYATHESSTLEAVVAARSKATQITVDPANLTAEKLAEYQKAQGAVSSALGKLLAVTENYPQLRANENFSELQAQLEGTENRITEARKRYNEAVQDYNVLIRKFPNNLFAGMFGFSKKEKFEASSGASEAPKVEF